MVEDQFGGGRLLLLELEIAVAFGAEIIRRGASEESAIVGTEAWSLAPVFFRHRLIGSDRRTCFCLFLWKIESLGFRNWGGIEILDFPVRWKIEDFKRRGKRKVRSRWVGKLRSCFLLRVNEFGRKRKRESEGRNWNLY